MSLSVTIRKRLKFIDLDMAFECSDGRVLVMIGPSGGGKTSIIRMLAGLDAPDEGIITFHDQVWFDSSRRINVPPRKRRLGYVFQDYTLFPHLNLYDNAAFAAVNKKDVDDLFELFSIGHLRTRKPGKVSGGERQRCAICQAMARRPQVLLLDEPFSALDAMTRRVLREELKNLKGRFSFPIVYVTHDVNEALYLADEMLPVVQGKTDEGWMKKMTARNRQGGKASRAARETKLALVY
ncbi:MAG: ATP-binding cassette domain-containing protein [Spirochaetes bacterium]|nr:MAG: ATP-binding cassette domain-containing protein [Spirochaetota bacterium]